MKVKLLIPILLITSLAVAQAPEIEWQKCYGGIALEKNHTAVKTEDGGYLMGGIAASHVGNPLIEYGGIDCRLIKIDSEGQLQWQKNYGGSDIDYLYKVIKSSDGGYVFVGSTKSNNGNVSQNNGMDDIWVVKVDTKGAILWEKNYGGSGQDSAYDICPTSDGGYVLIGDTDSIDGDLTGTQTGCWVVKIDAVGEIVWQDTYGGTAQKIIPDINGGYTGITTTKIFNINENGVIQWQIGFGTSIIANAILQTNDGGYLIGGYKTNDGWVAKMDATGTFLWQYTYGGSGVDIVKDMSYDNAGGFVLVGDTTSTSVPGFHLNGPKTDVWIFKISNEGILQWQRAFGSFEFEQAYYVTPTTDGGYFIGAYCYGNGDDVTGNNGGIDFWAVKLMLEAMSVDEFATDFKIFPNPTANLLNIQTVNPIHTITIFDVTGKKVLEQNTASSQINVQSLQQGMYIIQILSNGETTQQKFIKE